MLISIWYWNLMSLESSFPCGEASLSCRHHLQFLHIFSAWAYISLNISLQYKYNLPLRLDIFSLTHFSHNNTYPPKAQLNVMSQPSNLVHLILILTNQSVFISCMDLYQFAITYSCQGLLRRIGLRWCRMLCVGCRVGVMLESFVGQGRCSRRGVRGRAWGGVVWRLGGGKLVVCTLGLVFSLYLKIMTRLCFDKNSSFLLNFQIYIINCINTPKFVYKVFEF